MDTFDPRTAHPAASLPDEAYPDDAPRAPSSGNHDAPAESGFNSNQSSAPSGSNVTHSGESSTRPLLPPLMTNTTCPNDSTAAELLRSPLSPGGAEAPPPPYGASPTTDDLEMQRMATMPPQDPTQPLPSHNYPRIAVPVAEGSATGNDATMGQPLLAPGPDGPQLAGPTGGADVAGSPSSTATLTDPTPPYQPPSHTSGAIAVHQGDPNAKQAPSPIVVEGARRNGVTTRLHRYCWRTKARKIVTLVLSTVFTLALLSAIIFLIVRSVKRKAKGKSDDDVDYDTDDDDDDDDDD